VRSPSPLIKDLLKKKQAGEKIEAPKEREPANVVNLMEALRRSVEVEGGARAKQPARSVQHRSGAKKKASIGLGAVGIATTQSRPRSEFVQQSGNR
jgi:hypothetical protein